MTFVFFPISHINMSFNLRAENRDTSYKLQEIPVQYNCISLVVMMMGSVSEMIYQFKVGEFPTCLFLS